MKIQLRNIITELVWLGIVFCLTMFFCTYLFPWDTDYGSFDIHLHDTYYVIKASHLISAVFVFFTFLIFFCRGMAKRFSGNLRNIITIFCGTVVVYLIATSNHAMIPLGYDWYAIKEDTKGEFDPAEIFPPASFVWQNTLIVFELIIVLGMLYLCYQWGKSKSTAPK